ncbi:MAG: 2,3-bisphosphoglycerate-independent phosphoglycerate mutase, partial [SAR324 cluster bacterium]
GASGNDFDSIAEAITHFREQNPDLVDQDCPPFNIRDRQGKNPTIQSGDSLIHMNFRADRATEFTEAVTDPKFKSFQRDVIPNLYFAGMMLYDADINLPEKRIMESPVVENPFGRRLLSYGLTQFRLAETQKYAHVTFFFNGGYRQPLDASKEHYFLIASDKVNSFAEVPAMKAAEIADKAVELIQSGDFDYGLINIANTDMVGHTGNMQAAIKAAEVVDQALEKICKALEAVNGIALITADHGNADEMLIMNKKTKKEERCTKHSINLVPCILFDPQYAGDYRLQQYSAEKPIGLSMIAATNHILLGRDVPDDLDPSLFAVATV